MQYLILITSLSHVCGIKILQWFVNNRFITTPPFRFQIFEKRSTQSNSLQESLYRMLAKVFQQSSYEKFTKLFRLFSYPFIKIGGKSQRIHAFLLNLNYIEYICNINSHEKTRTYSKNIVFATKIKTLCFSLVNWNIAI